MCLWLACLKAAAAGVLSNVGVDLRKLAGTLGIGYLQVLHVALDDSLEVKDASEFQDERGLLT